MNMVLIVLYDHIYSRDIHYHNCNRNV